MGKKKKKKAAGKTGAGLPENKIELHLPPNLYARINAMKPEDVTEILRILFDCNASKANIFGVNDVDIYLAQIHASSDVQFDFPPPRKVCNP